jgi:3-hydroxyisobutyrate dehydrogenase-like beta-hydroxyacid dehydrogenase
MMGHGLAKHVQERGFPARLMFHVLADRQRCGDLLARGALGFERCDELAAQCDVVITCVTASPQVEDAVLGERGVLRGLAPGSFVVDCSTALPASTQRIAAAVAAKGCRFIDAAMTGTPKDAEAGAINLLVGGDAATLEALRPILSCFARNIFPCGAVGAGHTVKLLHNYVVLSNAAILAEAVSCARKADVDLATLCQVIATGGANSTAFQRMRPFIEAGDEQDFRFTIANALKDMRYYAQMTSDLGVVATLAGAVQSSYTIAANAGLADRFVPRLLDCVDKLNGRG